MHHVSLIIEFLRGRPAVVFWVAALTQAFLWTLIPALFYSAPPGDVPLLLAIGHEFVLGSYRGPPLAFWLGELAFRSAGAFGLYALAQACIVVAYWGVFTLGRAVVGTRHAVLGVLLMVGIAAFTVPSPDFGPAVLAAPFWALALLHYWRAVGENKRGSWFLLAIDLGLLLLSNYAGVVLLVLMILFTLAAPAGRRALLCMEPWVAGSLLLIVIVPHAAWLAREHALVLGGFEDTLASVGSFAPGTWLLLSVIATHLGLFLIGALAAGWPRKKRERAPEITRNPVASFARVYVFFFALAPAACAVALAYGLGHLGPFDHVTPLVVLSGLAVILAAGDKPMLYRERLVSSAWVGLLVAPPLLVVFGLVIVPWTVAADVKIAQPANTEGAFFAETYQRRIGKPLSYVSGDERIAPLIALGASSRPHVYFAWAPERSPWTNAQQVVTQGGILVWPAADNVGAPPPPLRAQFPAIVPEVPRRFFRAVQGRLPSITIGWTLLRPAAP